jgi:hypothetical protein
MRQAQGRAGGERNVVMLKAVVWLGLAAALFAAKLWPLAFMLLIAAGGVSAIETWRERAMKADDNAVPPATTPAKISLDEAASVLGVSKSANADEIKSAHKRLIGQLHPDKGGSDYLAAKINDARELMLKRAAATDALASSQDKPGDSQSGEKQ